MKIVFITGASSGFGRACAEIFHRQGWHVILLARRRQKLEELADSLSDQARVHLIQADVTDLPSLQSAVNTLPPKFADVELLINNAGLALGLGKAYQESLEDWNTMVDTNIKGLLYCTRLLLPGMVERRRGHVINLGSIAGDWPYPGANVYGATKSFVKQFSRNLRADLAGTPIRVTNIEPGMAETEFSITRFKGNQQQADNTYHGMEPLTAEDIADIIYWTATLPGHININRIEVMPVQQTWGPLAVHRE